MKHEDLKIRKPELNAAISIHELFKIPQDELFEKKDVAITV